MKKWDIQVPKEDIDSFYCFFFSQMGKNDTFLGFMTMIHMCTIRITNREKIEKK